MVVYRNIVRSPGRALWGLGVLGLVVRGRDSYRTICD